MKSIGPERVRALYKVVQLDFIPEIEAVPVGKCIRLKTKTRQNSENPSQQKLGSDLMGHPVCTHMHTPLFDYTTFEH